MTSIDTQSFIAIVASNMRTGNVMLDMLIMAIVARLSMVLIENFSTFWNWFTKYLSSIVWWGKYAHSVTIRFDYIEANKEFIGMHSDNRYIVNGILSHLHKKGMTKKSPTHDILVYTCEKEISTYNRYSKGTIMALPNSPVEYLGMEFRFYKSWSINSSEKQSSISSKVELNIKTNDTDATHKFMFDCQTEFLRSFVHDDNNIIYNYTMSGREYTGPPRFDRRAFESIKTFKSIFFKRKPEFLCTIADFITKRGMWNPEMERTYKMIIMLHGPPGCGKTSIIKALARHTKRHIIRLRLKDIKNDGDLSYVLFSPGLYHFHPTDGWLVEHVPINQRIYLLEDLDCDGVDHIIQARVDEKKDVKDMKNSKDTKDEKELEIMAGHFRNKITLSGLLNELDGVSELTGAMMVITTNKLDKFDSALIRPGRMDIMLELGHVDHEVVNDMLHFHYQKTSAELTGKKFKDITPAKVEAIIQTSLALGPDIVHAVKLLRQFIVQT